METRRITSRRIPVNAQPPDFATAPRLQNRTVRASIIAPSSAASGGTSIGILSWARLQYGKVTLISSRRLESGLSIRTWSPNKFSSYATGESGSDECAGWIPSPCRASVI